MDGFLFKARFLLEELHAMGFKQKMKLLLTYAGVVLTVVTVLQFVQFLSYLPVEQATPSAGFKLDENPSDFWSISRKTAWVLFQDLSFLCGFFFLHSFLADASIKDVFAKHGLQEMERSVYVILSCIVLQLLIRMWQPIPWLVLWDINVSSNTWLWWLYTFLHGYIWLLVYAGNLMLDISELLGIKQVEYCNRGLPSPESYKSSSLKSLRRHMYHTSFLGFSVLFWVYPYMRLDRAFLAILLQLYMGLNWGTSQEDVKYLKEQFEEKSLSLKE